MLGEKKKVFGWGGRKKKTKGRLCLKKTAR